MSNDINQPVVVGIDGSDDALKAMRWAAREASRHAWPVRLVHAYEASPGLFPLVEAATPAQTGQGLLRAAHDELTSGFRGLSVDTVNREGPAPRILLEEARRGGMLVVGREGLGRIAELVLGSVSLAVATHAGVPVVVVPASWEPPSIAHHRVIVGVDGSANCQAAVEFAFRVASDRDASLQVVYAWPQPSGMPQGWPLGGNGLRMHAEYDELIVRSIDGWPEKYPDVKVVRTSDLRHPAEAIRAHAHDADLVVIGGRGHGVFTGMLLGSVARAIVRHVDVPIVVVHDAKIESKGHDG